MRFLTRSKKVCSLLMATVMAVSVAGTAWADDLEEQLEDLQQKR